MVTLSTKKHDERNPKIVICQRNVVVAEVPMKCLKSLREASGLNQFEVAKRAGLDRTRLSLAENGHVQLTVDEADAVHSVLVCAVRERADRISKLLTDEYAQKVGAA